MAVSIALGAGLFLWPEPLAFLLLPLWMFLRRAFNAVDGMLAREFGQQSDDFLDLVSPDQLSVGHASKLFQHFRPGRP